MNRKELVAALEEHLWPQLTLVKVAGMGARCSGYAPEIGFGLPFSCRFPDGDDGSALAPVSKPAMTLRVLTLLLCGCPACRLCRREGGIPS